MLFAVPAVASAGIFAPGELASVCHAELEISVDLDAAYLTSVEVSLAVISQGVLTGEAFADFLAVGSCAFLVI